MTGMVTERESGEPERAPISADLRFRIRLKPWRDKGFSWLLRPIYKTVLLCSNAGSHGKTR